MSPSDIPKRHRHGSDLILVSSFADNTRVLFGVSWEKDVNKIQADLDIVYQWSENNNMALNADKFECLGYGGNESIKTRSNRNKKSL